MLPFARLSLILSLSLLAACSGKGGARLFEAIYGTDDRAEATSISDPELLERARATVGILPRTWLDPRADGSYGYRNRDIRPLGHTFCQDERFSHQPQLTTCSGVLIGPDLVLSAAHCLSLPDRHDPVHARQVCAAMAMVFDWVIDPTTGAAPPLLQPNQVAHCSEIVAAERDPVRRLDWVLIRLDRLVTDRTPAPLATPHETPAAGTSVVQISHPMGWPQKVHGGAEILRTEGDALLVANTDTYFGSSGGPLFSRETGRLIGILHSGTRDFEVDHSGPVSCARSRRCDAFTSCSGEKYFRVDTIAERLRSYLGGAPITL